MRSQVKARGFTLMELLVVLLIIGILSTVAIRTIDATRDRSLFDQTLKEMRELSYAMVGNPEITANGHRVDFGFYGDMMRLPNDLRELVENTSNSPNWRGPYLRREFLQDSVGYRYDAWGNPYTYNPATGTIATIGNGKYPMTIRVVDSIVHLTNNSIIGTVTDADNNPPGDKAATVGIYLYLPNGTTFFTRPDAGGYYEFTPASTHGGIPIGNHKIIARRPGGDSIVKWVTVVPRSRTVVDFRFSRLFRNYLQMVGTPRISGDSSGFTIWIVNPGENPDTVRTISFIEAPDSAYMRWLYIRNHEQRQWEYNPGVGRGDSLMIMPGPFVISPNGEEVVEFSFYNFSKTPIGGDTSNIYNKLFRLRFNDGSEFSVRPR
ncbi:MAG: prepilin-type N-terminal cleavage/methylation domain-containing protein [candidate division WOR-3 bacterium]